MKTAISNIFVVARAALGVFTLLLLCNVALAQAGIGPHGEYGYGYGGVDARGQPYGGAGGNGGYYVSGTDINGRPYTYNGGPGSVPPPGYNGYPRYYYNAASSNGHLNWLNYAAVLIIAIFYLMKLR